LTADQLSMKSICFCGLIVALVAWLFISPLARGQAPFSQNGSADLKNSLIPAKPHRPREKIEQVDPQKLPSKSIKDTTFQGTLMDIGVDWKGDKLGKPHSASDTDSKASKQSEPGSEKDSKGSKQADASGDKKTSKSMDGAGDGHNKDQKATPVGSDEKSPEKEKASASKPDGNH
jgi:hypothetical protein